MLWHTGAPDAPLSCCWPFCLPMSEKVSWSWERPGDRTLWALITHSVTITHIVWPPPPRLTLSWQAGKVTGGGSLWLIGHYRAKTALLCSPSWLTATKCLGPVSLRTGITHREEDTEIMGGVRRRVTGGILHPFKAFLLVVCCRQRGFFRALSFRSFSCWHPHCSRKCDWPRRLKEEREHALTGYPFQLTEK